MAEVAQVEGQLDVHVRLPVTVGGRRTHPADDVPGAHPLSPLVRSCVCGYGLQGINSQSANCGYRVVFATGILFFVLGTVLVSRIKSVR